MHNKYFTIIIGHRPKNQNKCWNNTGSPPPKCTKKLVLIFLSVKSIVNAPASTGKDKRSKNAVIKTDHANNGMVYIDKPRAFIFEIVTIKLMAPSNDETPARCKLEIAKSTAGPECAIIPERGG